MGERASVRCSGTSVVEGGGSSGGLARSGGLAALLAVSGGAGSGGASGWGALATGAGETGSLGEGGGTLEHAQATLTQLPITKPVRARFIFLDDRSTPPWVSRRAALTPHEVGPASVAPVAVTHERTCQIRAVAALTVDVCQPVPTHPPSEFWRLPVAGVRKRRSLAEHELYDFEQARTNVAVRREDGRRAIGPHSIVSIEVDLGLGRDALTTHQSVQRQTAT